MDNKIIRSCINCGADDYKALFSYTYNFMTQVRQSTPEYMEKVGWSKDVTSTIVKCHTCGFNYIRDVFPNTERQKPIPTLEEISRMYTYKRFRGFDEENWLVRNLVFFAVQRQKRDIKFLDFGAGSGTISNAARVYGVRDVIAYDPYSGYGAEEYKKFNFPGIYFTRNRDDLYKWAPFDIAVCLGVIEHTLNPRRELEIMYEIMSKGGFLYISNPLMDLDKELGHLVKAKSIKKKDKISHYHPNHLNYMTPRQFLNILEGVGFKITPMVFSPAVPFRFRWDKGYLIRDIKFTLLKIFCFFRLPYKRYIFIAEKC